MKNFALLALALIPSLCSAARPNAEIVRKAGVIGKLAYGLQRHTVRGEDAEEMILSLYVRNTDETKKEARENFIRNAGAKDAGFAESPGWGLFVNAGEAALYFANLQGRQDRENGEEKDNSKQVGLGRQIIRELGRMGAKFGYTDSTSGYCGVSLGGLLIVEEESDTIYEIALTGSGGC